MRTNRRSEIDDDGVRRGRRVVENARRHFTGLRDSRKRRGKRHALVDVAIIALLGILCGCDDADEIADWAEDHEDWLSEWFGLAHGTPSQDTILRVFELLKPESFAAGVASWLKSLRPSGGGQVAIDGKALRGSLDSAGEHSAVHIVSAWMRQAGLLLGQVKAADKSNEINAIPLLLEQIDVRGCLVSIDAAGTYRNIAGQIVEQGGAYLLAAKENQPTLRHDIEKLFLAAVDGRRRSVDELPRPRTEQALDVDSGHGRIEERLVIMSRDLEGLTTRDEWPGLSAVIKVESKRTHTVTGKVETEDRYYITNSPGMTAQEAQQATRGHWSVENELHWVLDVVLGEDASRIRSRRAAENFALVRRLALSLLRAAPTPKKRMSIRRRRRRCDSRADYLLQVLSSSPPETE